MPAPARNAPCPCGSGRKYKLCCLAPVEQRDAAWRASNRASQSAYDTILTIGTAMWPTRRTEDLLDAAWSDLWRGDPPTPAPEAIDMALLAPWMSYHWRPGTDDRVLAQLCLEAAPREFSAEEREWIDASLPEPFSLLEATEIVPGDHFRVHDLLLDEERVVYERSATKSVAPRSILLARTPVFRGVTTIDGLFPYTLPPVFRDELRARVGAAIGPFSSMDRQALREHTHELVQIFAELIEIASIPPPMPTLANTDGELLVLCQLRWRIGARSIAEARRRLSVLDTGNSRETFDAETASRWSWSKAGNAAHPLFATTALGVVWIDGSELLAECNSEARAGRLRRMIEDACDGIVTFVSIDRTTQAQLQASAEATRASGPTSDGKAPSELGRHAVAQLVAAHYDTWPDEPLPALAGRTPREAVATAKGRRQVDALLREMEHSTSRSNMAGLYDFGQLRRALGL